MNQHNGSTATNGGVFVLFGYKCTTFPRYLCALSHLDIYTHWVYNKYIKNRTTTPNKTEDHTMTKAERNAMNAYKKDLIAQGVDKETAATMAKVFIEYGIIKPVVNGN